MPRPSHPAPNVRDDRETPLMWVRDGLRKPLIWGDHEAEYFSGQDWTTQITLKRFRKFVFWRKSDEGSFGGVSARFPKWVDESLMHMFGPGGNATAENVLGVIGVLQAETGVHLEVLAVVDSA